MLTPEQVNRQSHVGALVASVAAAETLAGRVVRDGKVYRFNGKKRLDRALLELNKVNEEICGLFSNAENDQLNFVANDIEAVVRLLVLASPPQRFAAANDARRQYAEILALHGDADAPARMEEEIQRLTAARAAVAAPTDSETI